MIKLGKLTDYAVVLMVQLAQEVDRAEPFSAHYLAEKTGLPEPTVSKILKQLSRENLLDSIRGANGGYRLAQDATNISVCQVIEAMDGPIAIAGCVETICESEGKCPAKGRWRPVNNAIRMALSKITIAHMAIGGGCIGVTTPDLLAIQKVSGEK